MDCKGGSHWTFEVKKKEGDFIRIGLGEEGRGNIVQLLCINIKKNRNPL